MKTKIKKNKKFINRKIHPAMDRTFDKLNSIYKIRFHNSYQPLGDVRGPSDKRPRSSFQDRLNAIDHIIINKSPKNMLDLGCAEGFFVRQAALRHGLFALGVDRDQSRLSAGNAVARLKQERGYAFVRMEMTPNTIRCLPNFDIVVCFSVLHHIIHAHGEQQGRDFLQAIADITNEILIFDMGNPDEASHEWAKHISHLSGDVPANTASFLESSGFRDVVHIGDSYGHTDLKLRPIFACKPDFSKNDYAY